MKIDYVGKDKVGYLIAFIVVVFGLVLYYCATHNMKYCTLSCLTMVAVAIVVGIRDFVVNNAFIETLLVILGIAAMVFFSIGAGFGELTPLSNSIAQMIVNICQNDTINPYLKKVVYLGRLFGL